jgi:outer membrane receptor protein involved in Fe transport
MVAWSEEDMERAGVKGMKELGALTPSIEFDFFPENGEGHYTNIDIRGINGRNGSTVGVFLDDTALPAPGTWGGAFGRAFPLVFDLERVEVLRGPQSTLLGEGAEAGAVRFITKTPSLETTSTLATAEVDTTERGGVSNEVGMAIGGPFVAGVLGGRASVWRRVDGGFVNRVDPFTGAVVDSDANRSVSQSVRGALSIAPSSTLRIFPSVIYQSVSINDSSSFYTYLSDPGAGKLNNGKLLRQPVDDTFYLGSIRLTAQLFRTEGDLTGSYYSRRATALVDATNNSAFGGYGNPLGPEYPISYANAVAAPVEVQQSVAALEGKLASSIPGSNIRWLAGVSFSQSHNSNVGRTDAVGMEEWGPLVVFDQFTARQSQMAGYGQVTLNLNRQFVTDLGARVARERYDSNASNVSVSASDTTVTPRIALSYYFSGNNLAYATIAQGYRTGGVNLPSPEPGCTVPPTSYSPDTLWNYEIGIKSRSEERRAELDLSIFDAQWQNLQQFLAPSHAYTPCGYVGNGGSAASTGFEVTGRMLLTERWTASVMSAYTNAHYTQTVKVGDTVIVNRGDALGALPVVPTPWHIVASTSYAVSTGDTRVTVRAEDVFHSHNPGPFTSDDPASLLYAPGREPNPTTNLLNLRLDASWSNVDVALFVNNVFDAQPTLLLRNRCCFDTLFYATTFRPRTLGLSGTWHE